MYAEIVNRPNSMQLVVDIFHICFLLHKRENLLQLLLVTCLKSGRIVEDKRGFALEYERPMNIVYTSLIWVGIRHTSRYL